MFQDLMDEILPEGDGQFNIGEVLLLGLTIVLAIFTGFRSYDFILRSLPPGWDLVAYIGLFVLDVGFLVWALVIALSATSPVQIVLAWGMWLVDGLGLALVTTADTFFYVQPPEQSAAMVATVSAVAAWAFPLLAIINAAAAILYKIMDPYRILARRRRQQLARLRYLSELGKLQAQIEQTQARVVSMITDQRVGLADMKKSLTQRLAALERAEKELFYERMRNSQYTEGRAQPVASPVPQEVAGANGHQPQPVNFTMHTTHTTGQEEGFTELGLSTDDDEE